MTKNHRFTMYQNIIYDEGQIINPFECMKLLNYFYDENQQLKHIVDFYESFQKDARELEKENEQLKKEIAKFKECEKRIGDVKREDLDRVFKMSIYEIAEMLEYYRKRINEGKLNE